MPGHYVLGWLVRLRTDAGRTLRWNHNAIGQLLTVTESGTATLQTPDNVGLRVIRDAKTLAITAIEARTAADDLGKDARHFVLMVELMMKDLISSAPRCGRLMRCL